MKKKEREPKIYCINKKKPLFLIWQEKQLRTMPIVPVQTKILAV
jgi:hypothetical protein